MTDQEVKEYKILDWIIVSLFVIFILSLSNSIFINQVGYFGALLFIIIKAFLTRKNPFSKTGLELAFVLYMLAEFVSLIFSDYKAQAFHFFTKRALLIPVVYTTIVATKNLKFSKNYFRLFIAGSLITALVYLIASVQFYLNNQYAITQSGPSIFQHPITASEIISFVVLFLFAFIMNEKTDWKTKLLLYSGFAISVLTLIATYKRTGWMGVASGIILVLIVKRKWKILVLVLLSGIILILMDKNISMVSVYNFVGLKTEKLYSFNTKGRAYSVSDADSLFAVSDFENGILFYDDSVLVKRIQTSAPAVSFFKISDELFLAQLIDTRFLVFKKEGGDFILVNEILPPGETKSYETLGTSLYTLDSDSGLTYYESVVSNPKPVRFPKITNFSRLFIDSTYFYFISDQADVEIYLRDGMLPGKKVLLTRLDIIERAYLYNGCFLVSNSKGLRIFSFDGKELILRDEVKELKQIYRIISNDKELIMLIADGTIYKLKINANYKLEIITKDKLSPKPTNFYYTGGKLYCTYVNRGRLLSFFDPYLPQNFTRLALWRAGWEIFKDYPLFGVGDIGIEKYYVHYKRPYDKEIHGHLHNNYFHFLATLGLFGFLALMYLFIMIIVKISRIYKLSKGEPFIASYSLGTLAAFVNILVAGLSELNFWDQEIATLIYFTVGLNFALFFHHKEEIKES